MNTFEELIASEKPVLVDFFATWCGPCKMMHPILQQVKEAVGENATIVKIDVDKQQQLALQYNVQSVPTLLLFKDSKIIWREVGVLQAQSIINLINEHC